VERTLNSENEVEEVEDVKEGKEKAKPIEWRQ
jgi:hypothetical protein